MKKVITNLVTNKVILIDDINKSKIYIGEGAILPYVLKQDRTFQFQWRWVSILDPKVSIGKPFNTFIDALKHGLTLFEVYELKNITKLIKYLIEKNYLEIPTKQYYLHKYK